MDRQILWLSWENNNLLWTAERTRFLCAFNSIKSGCELASRFVSKEIHNEFINNALVGSYCRNSFCLEFPYTPSFTGWNRSIHGLFCTPSNQSHCWLLPYKQINNCIGCVWNRWANIRRFSFNCNCNDWDNWLEINIHWSWYFLRSNGLN